MIGVRVVCVLAVAAVAAASLGDNALDTGAGAGGSERVVLVAPVLAPPRDSRTHSNDRSRQFPILVLLAQQGQHTDERLKPEPKSLEGNPQPIYVKKLEDQTNNPHSRQKRHHSKKSYGGHGGYGGGYGGTYAVIPISFGYGHGGGGGYKHGGGGGYKHGGGGGGYYPQPSVGCGGCGGGGGGYSQSSSQAYASSSSSSHYGKR